VKVRYEDWGAWVRVESEPALVALDRAGARRLGLDGEAAWSEPRGEAVAPIEVHLAVTGRCGAGCEGCYLDARPDGDEPSFATLLRTLDALARAEVLTVAFGGGEPTLRDDLAELADAARARGMVPVLTTSGLGLTARRRARLTSFAQVNVSYDGAAGDYAEVRGFDGASAAEEAIAALVADGIAVGVNVVLTRATFPRLEATLERARELGAREVQLLRYKPAGRAAKLDYLTRRLSPPQIAEVPEVLRRLSARHAGVLRLRIDCAMIPFLSTMEGLDGARLRALGIFGCEAGDTLAAVRVDGKVAPCSFSPATSLDPADLGHVADDAEIRAFRALPRAPPEPCASCPLASACKGGCKVVARFVDGAIGADPECPRVRAHRRLAAVTA
jgi:radical SAM protein with 4Fe4S-binding SPASM domain